MKRFPFLILFLWAAAVCAQTRPQAASSDWTSYGKNSFGWRYSSLSQITSANVQSLAPQWIFQSGVPGKFEPTPLVFGGLMYFTGPSNHAWAIDLSTGRPIWTYQKAPPAPLNLCCGPVNRGFAVLGEKLFKVNIEGTLVALDAKSGSVLWETVIADYKKGYSATAAPLVVKNLVLVGIAGAEFGIRGFIDAYDADSGKRVWRFYVVPGKGEPGSESWNGESWKQGGGSTWVTGTYDPELNLTYWGTGNPGPDMDGSVRPGDNLYTCSLVALDPATGKLKWHFQFTPHDTHDWDAISDPVLVDQIIAGKMTKTVIQANRNGFFYVLDRTNGKFLHAQAYTKVNWAKGIDKNGRPEVIPGMEPSEQGTLVCPALGGGHNWQAGSYSPATNLYYFNTTDGCQTFYKNAQDYVEGEWYQASLVHSVSGKDPGGSILAADPATGAIRWRFPIVTTPSAGTLSTAGGLVFAGDKEGYFIAFDARSGKVLWKFQTGGMVLGSPVTYLWNGRQYIAIAAGQSMFAFALPAAAR